MSAAFLYPRMPPRRQKRPSAMPPVEPPPKRTRRITKATGKDKVQRMPAPTAESTTMGLPPSAASTIPPALLEQIVSNHRSYKTVNTPSYSCWSVCSSKFSACTLTEVTTASGDSQASLTLVAAVNDSVNAVNATLSGEVLPATTSTPLPSVPLFNSASLSIDSREDLAARIH